MVLAEPTWNYDCQRSNVYKHFTKELGTWLVVSHHVAFVPLKLTPVMPSGNMFCRALITIQIEQRPLFYNVKLLAVLFPLTLISSSRANRTGNVPFSMHELVCMRAIRATASLRPAGLPSLSQVT